MMGPLSAPMKNRSRALRAARLAGLAALVIACSAWLAVRAVGWWIDCGEEPVKSDIMVVLAGDYARPAFAAGLYAQGYAPDVWISRPERTPALAKLDGLGIHLPREESINRDILIKRGVPEIHVRLYGRDARSTAEEAEALRGEFPSAGKKILIVTSRFHVRRARMIFRRLLPGAEIHVVAEPYDASQKEWWKDRELADNAILETFKTVYFLLGGRMR